MKNFITVAIVSCLSINLLAQLPVSTLPQNKKVLLEHIYGFKCYWSPQGDSIAEYIKKGHNPGDVVVATIHNFYNYSAPSGSWPDYQTAEGNQIRLMPAMNCNSIPSGPVNRHLWPGFTGMAMDRSYWKKHCDSVLKQPAYVNVAIQGALNVTTRVLTVQVEAYYTGNSPVNTNSLTIYLLEDSVRGPQISPKQFLSNWNSDGTYNHCHMLRKCLTPTFGTSVINTTVGSFYSNSFTYTVPATFGIGTGTNTCNLGHLKLAAFITETDREVQTVASGPIVLNGFANSLDIGVHGIKTPSVICSSLSDATFKFYNYGSNPVTNATFYYIVNNGSPILHTWYGSAQPYTNSQTVFAPGTLSVIAALPSNTLQVIVGTVNGSADANALNNNAGISAIKLTTTKALNLNMQMDFLQDQYGSECQWTVIDESSGAIVATDGPWNNLAASGTSLHTKYFTVSPNTCYKLLVTDKNGDGINSGSGAGNYNFKSGSVALFNSQGFYGSEEVRYFKTAIPTGLPDYESSEIQLYPNPASESTKITLQLDQNNSAIISVMNSLGQIVYSKDESGSNAAEIFIPTADWPAGVYFVHVSAGDTKLKKTLVIAR